MTSRKYYGACPCHVHIFIPATKFRTAPKKFKQVAQALTSVLRLQNAKMQRTVPCASGLAVSGMLTNILAGELLVLHVSRTEWRK